MFFLVFCFFYFFLVLGLFSLVCLPPHAPLPVVLPTACPPSHFFLGFGFVFSCVLASACSSSRCIAYCMSPLSLFFGFWVCFLLCACLRMLLFPLYCLLHIPSLHSHCCAALSTGCCSLCRRLSLLRISSRLWRRRRWRRRRCSRIRSLQTSKLGSQLSQLKWWVLLQWRGHQSTSLDARLVTETTAWVVALVTISAWLRETS